MEEVTAPVRREWEEAEWESVVAVVLPLALDQALACRALPEVCRDFLGHAGPDRALSVELLDQGFPLAALAE